MIFNAVKPVISSGTGAHRVDARPQARRESPKSSIAVRKSEADLLIYEDIGDFFGIGISAADVVRDLDALPESVQQLNVRINSPGGDVYEGAAIYNRLARMKIPVTAYIDGLAASIASIIPMAADRIIMADNAMMMVHNPWMLSMGDADQLRCDAKLLDVVRDSLVRVYSARTGQAPDSVSAMMAEETWMDAEKSVAEGFADEKTDPVRMSAHWDIRRYKYSHTPEAILDPPKPAADADAYREKLAGIAARVKSI